MKISFLIHSSYGVGGTIRSTLNLATALADRHEVEIASVFHRREAPAFRIDPRIRVVPLLDTRPSSPDRDTEHPLHQQPSAHFPRDEGRYRHYSRLTDERVRAYCAASDADVIVGTRPGLTAYVAQFAPPDMVRVGQENMTYNHHSRGLRTELAEHIAQLDALVTVSGNDADVYRAHLPPSVPVRHIPNSVPAPQLPPSYGTSKTVIAAGRLAAIKEYDVLVDAFARVVARHPDWELRIYGNGDQRAPLHRHIDARRLYNHVHLMGPRAPLDPEWVKASVAVSTSRHESFGMTLVEAMRCGLPVVSTDCDYGPREIIRHGTDGLLVPVGDTKAVAGALLTLIENPEQRHRLAAEALRSAERFDPDHVAQQYEELFASLLAHKERATGAAGTRPEAEAGTEAEAEAEAEAGAGTEAEAEAGSAGPAAAIADCTARDDGSLTVRFEPPLASLPGGGFRAEEDALLVCTRRRHPREVLTFRVDPDGEATIPGPTGFAEGVWDVAVTPAAEPEQQEPRGPAERLPVRARTVDQRGAMRPREETRHTARLHHLVPETDHDSGHLTLHSWSRAVHAEVTEVHVVRREFVLVGALYGADSVAGVPRLLLRRRGSPEAELSFPGEWTGPRRFLFTVPFTAPAARQHSPHDVWDLRVRYAPDAEPVRAGRFLDDIVEKKSICSYPRVVLPKGGRYASRVLLRYALARRTLPQVRLRVFHSRRNDLAVNVVDVRPDDPPRHHPRDAAKVAHRRIRRRLMLAVRRRNKTTPSTAGTDGSSTGGGDSTGSSRADNSDGAGSSDGTGSSSGAGGSARRGRVSSPAG